MAVRILPGEIETLSDKKMFTDREIISLILNNEVPANDAPLSLPHALDNLTQDFGTIASTTLALTDETRYILPGTTGNNTSTIRTTGTGTPLATDANVIDGRVPAARINIPLLADLENANTVNLQGNLTVTVTTGAGTGRNVGATIIIRQGDDTLLTQVFDTYHNEQVTFTFDIPNREPLTYQLYMNTGFDFDPGEREERTFAFTGFISETGVLLNVITNLINARIATVVPSLDNRITVNEGTLRTNSASLAALNNFMSLFTLADNVVETPTEYLVNGTAVMADSDGAYEYTVLASQNNTRLRIGYTPAAAHLGFQIRLTRGSTTTTPPLDLVGSDRNYFYAELIVLEDDVLTGVVTRSIQTTRLHQRVTALEHQVEGMIPIVNSGGIQLLDGSTVADIDGNRTYEATPYNVSLSNNTSAFASNLDTLPSGVTQYIVNPLRNQANSADGTIVLAINGHDLVEKTTVNGIGQYRVFIQGDTSGGTTTRTETAYLGTSDGQTRNIRLPFGITEQNSERNEVAVILNDDFVDERILTISWVLYVNGNRTESGSANAGWVPIADRPIHTFNIGGGQVVLSVESRTQSGGERDFLIRATPNSTNNLAISGSYLLFDVSYQVERMVPVQPRRDVLLQFTNAPLVIGVNTSGGTYTLTGNFDSVNTGYSTSGDVENDINALNAARDSNSNKIYDAYGVTSGQNITPEIIQSLEGHKNVFRLGLFTEVVGSTTHTLTIPARVVPNVPMVYLDTFDTSRSDATQQTRTLTAAQLNGISILYVKYAINHEAWIDLRPFKDRERTETYATNNNASSIQIQSTVMDDNFVSLRLSRTGSANLPISVIKGY